MSLPAWEKCLVDTEGLGRVLTCHARRAVAAESMEPTHAHPVADFEVGDLMNEGANLCDDSNTFMAKSLVIVTIVLIGATDTTMGNLDDCFSRPSFTMAGGLDNLSFAGAFENREIDTHGGTYCWLSSLGKKANKKIGLSKWSSALDTIKGCLTYWPGSLTFICL